MTFSSVHETEHVESSGAKDLKMRSVILKLTILKRLFRFTRACSPQNPWEGRCPAVNESRKERQRQHHITSFLQRYLTGSAFILLVRPAYVFVVIARCDLCNRAPRKYTRAPTTHVLGPYRRRVGNTSRRFPLSNNRQASNRERERYKHSIMMFWCARDFYVSWSNCRFTMCNVEVRGLHPTLDDE
jgi:hypothetical protein